MTESTFLQIVLTIILISLFIAAAPWVVGMGCGLIALLLGFHLLAWLHELGTPTFSLRSFPDAYRTNTFAQSMPDGRIVLWDELV